MQSPGLFNLDDEKFLNGQLFAGIRIAENDIQKKKK
jgi:hypothetical protein